MSLRRLLVAAALAVFVAFAAHEAGFGTSHAFGGAHGSELTGATGALIALLLVAGLGWVAFGRTRRLSRTEASGLLAGVLPGSTFAATAALLAGGGLVAFAAIEFIEGHAPLAGGWALLLVPLAALAEALGARWIVECLAAFGVKLAALAGDLDFAVPRLTMLAASAAPAVRFELSRGTHRGRAPPQA